MFLPRPTVLASAAALLLAACSGSSHPTDAATAAAPALPAAAAAATADPAQALLQANQRFAALHSFHAEMRLQGARPGQVVQASMDFVAPDRYRLDGPGGVQTIIGGTLFLQAAGRIEQVPLPDGLLDQWRSPLPGGDALRDWSVEDRGPAQLDGRTTRAYLVHGPEGSGETLQYWLDGDGLPLQVQRDGYNHDQPYRVVLRYSRQNDPGLRVDIP